MRERENPTYLDVVLERNLDIPIHIESNEPIAHRKTENSHFCC